MIPGRTQNYPFHHPVIIGIRQLLSMIQGLPAQQVLGQR